MTLQWSTIMFSVGRVRGEARLLLDKGADPMIVNCGQAQRATDIAASSRTL